MCSTSLHYQQEVVSQTDKLSVSQTSSRKKKQKKNVMKQATLTPCQRSGWWRWAGVCESVGEKRVSKHEEGGRGFVFRKEKQDKQLRDDCITFNTMQDYIED